MAPSKAGCCFGRFLRVSLAYPNCHDATAHHVPMLAQVGALEEAQLAVHRQRAAEAFAKQEALKRHGGGGAPSDAAVPSELAGKKQQ